MGRKPNTLRRTRARRGIQEDVDMDQILKDDARYGGGQIFSKQRATATNAAISAVWATWTRFCHKLRGNQADPEAMLLEQSVETIRLWLQFRIRTSAISKMSTIFTQWRFLLLKYTDLKGQNMPTPLRTEIHGIIHGPLVEQFGLDLSLKAKPVMSVEDLLIALNYLWVYSQSSFPTERQRLQLATLMLASAYTSSRPGALVEASCAYNTNECLSYSDIDILLIPNPAAQDPQPTNSAGISPSLVVMTITCRWTKGNRKTNKPIKFLFHERETTLAMCPIAHFLALALADEAFEAEGIRNAEDVYAIRVPEERNSLCLRWKKHMLDIPIFRRSVRCADGIITSDNKALPYNIFNKYLKRLGKEAGFREDLTPYCIRRGTANAVDGNSTSAERNQMMGHSSDEIFLRHYLQQQVKADVQSAYLGTPSKAALIKAVGRMSIDRDPRVPQSLSAAEVTDVDRNPDLMSLATTIQELRKDILSLYHKLRNAVGTDLYKDYMLSRKRYRNIRRALFEEKLASTREEFFQAIDTREIEAQFNDEGCELSKEEQSTQDITPKYRFEERHRLSTNLFADLDGSVSRFAVERCAVINDMVALTFKQEPFRKPRHGNNAAFALADVEVVDEDAFEEPDIYPIACPSTICLFCLGNENLDLGARIFAYSRKDNLSRHVNRTHLRFIMADAVFKCPHPGCDDDCHGHKGFKHHAATIHNIWHSV